MTATTTSESPTAVELQGAVPIGSGAVLGGWVDAKEKLPPYLTPVLLLDVNRYMAFDPYGNWKGVGVLAGEEMWKPYWSVIGERGGLMLDAVTHWMPIPANPPNEKS